MDSVKQRIKRGNLNPPLLEPWEVELTTDVQRFKHSVGNTVLCLIIDPECKLPRETSSNEHVLTLPHALTLLPQEEVHATIGNCCWSDA